MLLITEADQYMGYALTSHLARHPDIRQQIRLTCKDKKVCMNFERKGMDVQVVDYYHPHQVSKAMRGVDHLILAVGYEDDRVAMAKYLCQTAVQSGVQSIILISHVGAVSQTHSALKHYGEIEELVMNTSCQWTILRPDWIHQHFHLWAPFIEKHRHLPLPMPGDAEMCPIDISDICKVVEHLVLEPHGQSWRTQLEENHVGQVYTLTGSQPVNPKLLVNMLSQATGYNKMEYKWARSMDLAFYLQDLQRDIWFDARLKQEFAQIYRDNLETYEYRSKVLSAPTATQIQTMLDYFDWVAQTSSSICVPHAPMITSLPCRPLRKFFQENANTFKPRV
ncbi:NAD(P)-binding protein [Hesseltinella vesiculosa]|uniref:NAD(P)-binding protein n=1 Tax=Hesseltinella vesiculosa TaxID=101127 RepID=A0A1X2GJN8_9FUNG|nr:NAD(P)-binding protein [Hesseltinella vesiculosa]